MNRIVNDSTLKQVRQNDSFISKLVCCGAPVRVNFSEVDRVCATCGQSVDVTLVRTRDPVRQSCKWSIFIGGAKGTFIDFLSCGYCQRDVTTLDRRCACGYFCSVWMISSNTYRRDLSPVWDIHRCVLPSVDEAKEATEGVHIYLEEPNLSTEPLLLDVSNIKTHLGALYCPDRHDNTNEHNLDEDFCCPVHRLRMSAVLVRGVRGIWVKLYAADAFGERSLFPFGEPLPLLKCPWCRTQIVDPKLSCPKCPVIIDVGLKRYKQLPDRRDVKWTHVAVELMPRTSTAPYRPADVLPMVGEAWTNHVLVTSAISDNVSVQSHPVLVSDTTPPESLDAAALRAKILRLRRRKYTFRQISTKLGISVGKIQYLLKKKPAELTSKKLR